MAVTSDEIKLLQHTRRFPLLESSTNRLYLMEQVYIVHHVVSALLMKVGKLFD